YIYTIRIAKAYDNLLIKANALDHRNDCILTSFNLIAALMSMKGIYFIDGLVGIGIAVWIFIAALEIFKKSYDVLMDKAIEPETKEKVLQIIKSHKEVLRINHFNSTPIGYQYQISFTIFVDGNLSTFKSHAIADHLEDEINEKIPEIYLTIVHVNPTKVKKKKK
ncbi:MAG: cation diffusion facilitator family transporter, partial [Bacilli bacterium]|nr:cation diffusion facilitator family transporter [Bacilli bacterium]